MKKLYRMIGLGNTGLGKLLDLLERNYSREEYDIVTSTRLPSKKKKILIVTDRLALTKHIKILEKTKSVIILLESPPVLCVLLPGRHAKNLLDIREVIGTVRYTFKEVTAHGLKSKISKLLDSSKTIKIHKDISLIPILHREVEGQLAGDFLTMLMSISNPRVRSQVKLVVLRELLDLMDAEDLDFTGLRDSLKGLSSSAIDRVDVFLDYLKSTRGENHLRAIAECNNASAFVEGKKTKSPKYKEIAKKHGVMQFDLKYIQKQRKDMEVQVDG